MHVTLLNQTWKFVRTEIVFHLESSNKFWVQKTIVGYLGLGISIPVRLHVCDVFCIEVKIAQLSKLWISQSHIYSFGNQHVETDFS